MWFSRKHCHLPPVLQEMLFAKASKLQHSHPFYIGLSQTLTTMLKRVTLAEESAATMLLLSQLDAHNTAHPSQTNDPFLYPVAKIFGRVRSLKPHLKQGHTTQHSVAPTTETEHSSVFATKTSSRAHACRVLRSQGHALVP